MEPPLPILKETGLLTKILEGECVLVLGPRVAVPTEIVDGQSTAIDSYLTKKLIEGCERSGTTCDHLGLRGAIARYETLKGPSRTRTLIQSLISDFENYSTDFHRDLASLPFKLVLTATPDRMMANAFRSQKKSVLEACYNYCGVSSAEHLPEPTVDRPIVYSLLGRYDRPSSMVLNDKNLLDYLVCITKESPALPDAVRSCLRATSTVFLFVGFGFTNWWLRLLLKVLDVTGVENRTVSLALEDSDSFVAPACEDNRTFFERDITIIHAENWNALAKDLVAWFGKQSTGGPAPKMLTGGAQKGPRVFLSYASEDADRVDALRIRLQALGINVWLDRQNLRGGQNWEAQIQRIINEVDYFVFVQTENMDQRDQRREPGVYNAELNLALERMNKMPYSDVFVIHVTFGSCRPRREPGLQKIHRLAVNTESDADKVGLQILEAYKDAHAGSMSQVA